MENTSENRQKNQVLKPSKHINIGLLAHVDAGKTTLAESLLYHTGSIRKMGRVDHQDAFLDTNEMERARGITIFSKQAVFDLKDKEITLLDTPGHVDFSAEMERTLQVLVIDTLFSFTMRNTLSNDLGIATASSLFQSVVGTVLMVFGNWLSRKVAGFSMF